MQGKKSLETMHASKSESNTKSEQGLLALPDRETPRASHANAASYFLVVELQVEEVGLQNTIILSQEGGD